MPLSNGLVPGTWPMLRSELMPRGIGTRKPLRVQGARACGYHPMPSVDARAMRPAGQGTSLGRRRRVCRASGARRDDHLIDHSVEISKIGVVATCGRVVVGREVAHGLRGHREVGFGWGRALQPLAFHCRAPGRGGERQGGVPNTPDRPGGGLFHAATVVSDLRNVGCLFVSTPKSER